MDAQLTSSPYEALRKRADVDPRTLAAQEDSARMITKLTALMLGAGIAGRGGMELLRMFRQPPEFTAIGNTQPMELFSPVQKKRKELPELKKLAADGSWLESLSTPLANWFKSRQSWLTDGGGATSKWGIPATLGMGLPLGALALYGGYKGTDWLLDKRRKAEVEGELDDAKTQYAALLGKIEREREKRATADVFDDMAEGAVSFAKQAATEPGLGQQLWEGVKNVGGALGGGWGAYTLLTALLSGKLSYDFFNRRSERATTEEAMLRRARQRTGGSLPQYVMTPETDIDKTDL